eukprot:12412829-Karenia_brevis.AAC.1
MGVRRKALHSRSWQRSEHITALECRSFVWCIRHLTRSHASRGKAFLLIGDTLVNALALCKGRTSARGLLRPVRQSCSILLRRNVAAKIRWTPSEVNPSDGPSRGVPLENEGAIDAGIVKLALEKVQSERERKAQQRQVNAIFQREGGQECLEPETANNKEPVCQDGSRVCHGETVKGGGGDLA